MKKMIILMVCISFFTTGCESMGNESLLPGEIVASAIETNEKVEDYHMISTMKIFENEKLTDEMTMEEWSSKVDGQSKRRTEITSKQEGKTISVLNENELILYQEDTNEVFTFKNEIGDNSNLNKSLKERTINELDMISNMYNIQNLGKEEINGRDTYHIKGTPKKESTLLGNYEIWIDEENWIVVKSISNSGDMEIILENEKVNLSPKIDPSIFKLEIPDDAKIVDLDEDISNTKEITVEQANKKFEGKLLYINDENYKIEKIQSSTYDSKEIPDEIVFSYSKDGEEIFTMSVLKKQEEIKMDGSMGFKEKEIRGSKAYIMEDIINLITFYEEGLQYNLIIEDEKIKMEEAIEIVENMEEYK